MRQQNEVLEVLQNYEAHFLDRESEEVRLVVKFDESPEAKKIHLFSKAAKARQYPLGRLLLHLAYLAGFLSNSALQ